MTAGHSGVYSKPRLQISTGVVAIAAAATVLLLFVIGGYFGDAGMGLWLYGTCAALISGFAGLPLALRNVDVVPRWQWLTEGAVAALAVGYALFSIKVALF